MKSFKAYTVSRETITEGTNISKIYMGRKAKDLIVHHNPTPSTIGGIIKRTERDKDETALLRGYRDTKGDEHFWDGWNMTHEGVADELGHKIKKDHSYLINHKTKEIQPENNFSHYTEEHTSKIREAAKKIGYTYKESLEEAMQTKVQSDRNATIVHHNPTVQRLATLIQKTKKQGDPRDAYAHIGSVRGYTDTTGQSHAWDGYDLIHAQVSRALGHEQLTHHATEIDHNTMTYEHEKQSPPFRNRDTNMENRIDMAMQHLGYKKGKIW